jgi:hypothetical protein
MVGLPHPRLASSKIPQAGPKPRLRGTLCSERDRKSATLTMATTDGTTPPGTAEDVTAAASLSAGGKTAKDLENTVLLGRGKSHLNHHGNKHFQGACDFLLSRMHPFEMCIYGSIRLFTYSNYSPDDHMLRGPFSSIVVMLWQISSWPRSMRTPRSLRCL